MSEKNDTLIAFEEIGNQENESILFLHGVGASRWMWWQQFPVFSDYHLIAVDLPGHGKSVDTPWKSLEDTTTRIAEQIIRNRQVHVVGISLGGHVALELAKHYPDNVRSLFVSGIHSKPLPFQSLLRLQSWFIQLGQQNQELFSKLAVERYRLPDDKINEFFDNYQLMTRETYETIGTEIMKFTFDESYQVIEAPSLILAGEKESRWIIKSTEIGQEILPNAIGATIPNAHHAWPVQNGEQFNRILREWLIQLEKL